MFTSLAFGAVCQWEFVLEAEVYYGCNIPSLKEISLWFPTVSNIVRQDYIKSVSWHGVSE